MNIRGYIKKTLRKIVPETAWVTLLSIRSRRFCHRLYRDWGVPKLNAKLFERFGNHCIGGLFPNLVLPSFILAEQMGPILLGTYEKEIAPWLKSIQSQNYTHILDIGAKFGFYAIGLARWFPQSRVMAFDTDPWARKATRLVAEANGVANVEVFGFCSPEWLVRNLPPNAFIFSDCEGYEFTLFQPGKIQNLATATLIIESHDASPWMHHLDLIKRFQETHYVEEVESGAHDRINQCDADLSFLTPSEQVWAVSEPRSAPQKWLFLRPKAQCSPSFGSSSSL